MKLGCWKDDNPPALTSLEQYFKNDPYITRENAIINCYAEAKQRGYKLFALKNGGECFASNTYDAYMQHGRSPICLVDGKGGLGYFAAYEIITGNNTTLSM